MTSILLLQEEPEESRDAAVDSDDASSETLRVPGSAEDEPPAKKWKPPKTVLQVFEFINLLWAYTIIFLGSALSIGLLLNLCGYAYTFSFTEGVRIDTIQMLRQESQFQKEIRRSAKEEYRSTLPR